MSEIEKKPIKITETVLRDAHQSLIATRMPTEFMLPIVDKMDKVGYQYRWRWTSVRSNLPRHLHKVCNPEYSVHGTASVTWCF